MTFKEKLRELLKDESIQDKLDSMEIRLDELEASIPTYEEFETEDGDVRITKEVYNKMCEYLNEDEIDLMGLT